MRILVSLLLLTVTVTLVLATDEPKSTSPYRSLYAEWKVEVESLDNATPPLVDAKKRTLKQEINSRYAEKFVKLAQTDEREDVWLGCLVWMIVESSPGKPLDEMIDVLHRKAAGVRVGVRLQLLMSELIPLQSDKLNPALTAIADKHSDKGVRGAALYALAARTKRLSEENGDLEGCRASEKLLERVISEFPDVVTHRGKNKDNAAALLDELQSPIALGKPAPAVQGTTLSGDEFRLADHRGKVIVVSFSGHWCAPCVAMHEIQKQLLAKYDQKQLTILEINSDKPESLDTVRYKIATDSLKWQVLPDGPAGPISKEWSVTSWPTYYVLDQNLRIRHRGVGRVGQKLIDWVDDLWKDDK